MKPSLTRMTKAESTAEWALAEKIIKRMGQVRTRRDDWWQYRGGRWLGIDGEAWLPTILDILPNRIKTDRTAQAVLRHVRSRQQLSPDEKWRGCIAQDGAAVKLNLADGTLWIWPDKVELKKHNPADFFTGRMEARWNPEATCPAFHKVCQAALPEVDDQALLHWSFGHVLYPTNDFEKVLILFGPGGTGKSTILTALDSLFNRQDSMMTRLSLAQLCSLGPGAYGVPKLEYAAVNVAFELSTVELDDNERFKNMVSGEGITVRPIYGKPYDIWPTTKFIFAANTLPRFRHGTDAELRRLNFLPFTIKPKEVDETLKTQVANERDGILRWMVEGLQSIMTGSRPPAGSTAARAIKRKFAVSNDSVGYFVKFRCEMNPTAVVVKEQLLAAYQEFIQEQGLPQVFENSFFKLLYERFPNQVWGFRARTDSTDRIQMVQGLRLLTEPERIEAEAKAGF